MRPDVLVVGGGSTGWAVASFFARARRSVVVIERQESRGGARWINGVPEWCFEGAGLARPSAPELWGGGERHAFIVQSASGSRRVCVARSPTLHVDMRHLVARLSEGAREHGATQLRGSVERVEVRDGRVAEVWVRTHDSRVRVCPRLCVDASGIGGALRRRVPALASRCPDVAPEDRCSAAQFVMRVRDGGAYRGFLERHEARPGDSLAFLGIAGGFSTLTLFTDPELSEIGILTGSIPAMGVASGPDVLRDFVERTRWIGERVFGGQGAIPLRRPYATLGHAGVALVGDAGCQVYASHGSGVGMGLLAARQLADASAHEDDPGAPLPLARYQRTFHARFGGLLASADALRRRSQELTSEHLGELLDAGLLDERAVELSLAQRELDLDPRWVVGLARRAVARPRAAWRLAPTLARSGLAHALARHAPAAEHPRASVLFDRALGAIIGRTPPPSAPTSVTVDDRVDAASQRHGT